ncbi:hypothetical protein CEXT_212481 [Caerostris extrusa]|uniref:Uncharacterized protein n=1 Tax=Caerostris extrusa TaxID=172846 RepID=A0AAV4R448_CAEEX|nr:hypothetical protein CEXT_212481 [Caerostris extrusa]
MIISLGELLVDYILNDNHVIELFFDVIADPEGNDTADVKSPLARQNHPKYLTNAYSSGVSALSQVGRKIPCDLFRELPEIRPTGLPRGFPTLYF